MSNLWSQNTFQKFWSCLPDEPYEVWEEAICKATAALDWPLQVEGQDELLCYILGEGQFGPDCWRLSPLKRAYYLIKPLLPCQLRYILRRIYRRFPEKKRLLDWPVEDRYVRFQYEVLRQLMQIQNLSHLAFRYFWPGDYHYTFILTHDIETANGQSFVHNVIDLEESFGFHSSFNFIPEKYELDYKLIHEIKERGFEVGVHGLKHDGKLFNTQSIFLERAKKINYYLNQLGATGFRSPLMMRNPEWMQALKIDYDLSFFDTDPYEPNPGGVMSIWPFTIGHFIELPYTLPQDSTIYLVLCESTPKIWLDKVDFIEHHHGMALINTHPDYLRDGKLWNIYGDFLQKMKDRNGYWQPLPHQAANWWRKRSEADADDKSDLPLGAIRLIGGQIILESSLSQTSDHQAR